MRARMASKRDASSGADVNSGCYVSCHHVGVGTAFLAVAVFTDEGSTGVARHPIRFDTGTGLIMRREWHTVCTLMQGSTRVGGNEMYVNVAHGQGYKVFE